MKRRSRCLLALVCLAAIVENSPAQSSDSSSRPGVTANNRFFGFVPQHEKLATASGVDPGEQVRTSDVWRANNNAADGSLVQQAGYAAVEAEFAGTEFVGSADCECAARGAAVLVDQGHGHAGTGNCESGWNFSR